MGDYSYASARERAAKHTSGFESTSIKLPEGVKLWRPKKAGVYKIDIIPFIAGEGNPYADKGQLYFERSFHVHPRLGGPDGDTYVCPRKTADLPCPICEFQKKLMEDPDADEKLVKSLWPRERQLFQLIDLAEPDKGIQIWDVSFKLFGQLLDEIMKSVDENDPDDLAKARFYHLTKGRTLKVTLTEKSMGGKNTFLEATVIEFKTREPYDEKILKKGYCLDDLLRIEDYDTLKEALEGGGTRKKKDDDDEKPKRRSDDEDRPRRRSEEDEDKPKRRDDDDEKPRRREDDDDRPKKRDDDDEKPKRRDDDDDRPKRRSDEDDDKPKKPAADDDDWDKEREKPKKPAADDEDKPKRRSDDDDEKPKRRSDDDDEKPKSDKGGKKPKDDDWD